MWCLKRTEEVLPRSDRMAVIVSPGKDTPARAGAQQMSEPCVSGTIQLPPDGNPVILLAEHQVHPAGASKIFSPATRLTKKREKNQKERSVRTMSTWC